MQVRFLQLLTKQVSIQVSVMTVRLDTLPAVMVKCHNISDTSPGSEALFMCCYHRAFFAATSKSFNILHRKSYRCNNEEQITTNNFVVANT